MNNKKLLVVLGIVVVILGVIVGVFIAGQKKDPEAQAKKKDSAQPKTGVKLDVGKAKKYDAPEHSKDHPIAVITFTDGSVIRIELYPEVAPVTVENFIKLCGQKFYDGLTIHRVVADTLIQGGDRNGDGTYRMDYAIRGEFKDNGWNNRVQHVRGTVSMARWSNDLNSADAQFFIMLSTHYAYDSKYAGFATITSGMAYIEELANAEVVEGTDRPVHPAVIETIRILGN